MTATGRESGWAEVLGDEDLQFIKRFVLASGSLKEMAAVYGVSYPTVRLRLDRIIAKIEVAESGQVESEFERLLRLQHAEGKVSMESLKLLLAAHRRELEEGTDRKGQAG